MQKRISNDDHFGLSWAKYKLAMVLEALYEPNFEDGYAKEVISRMREDAEGLIEHLNALKNAAIEKEKNARH